VKKEIELIRYVRSNILNLIRDLTTEQLNKIPEKFNNNIAWNLAHLVITQQIMAYQLGGLPLQAEVQWLAGFAPGTKPERQLLHSEIEVIRCTLSTSIDQLEQDYENGRFNSYKMWDLHGVMNVSGIEDAIKVTSVHEGRHYGVITALVNMVS
jgi:hypothetical protein